MKVKRIIINSFLILFIVILLIITPKIVFLRVGLTSLRPTEISYLYCLENDETDQMMKSLVERFNDSFGKEIGIYVNAKNYRSIEYISERVEEMLVGGADSFQIGDINTVSYEIGYLAKTMNKIAAFDDYMQEDSIKDYIPGFLERGRYTSDSKRYIFPLDNSTSVLYVNYDLWEKFLEERPDYDDSVFQTWEDLIVVANDYYDWTDSLTPERDNDGRAFLAFDALEDYFMVGSNQLMASIIQPGHKQIRLNLDRNNLYTLWEQAYEGFVYGGLSLERWSKVEDMLVYGEIVAYIAPIKNVKDFPFAYRFGDYVGETDLKVFAFPHFKNQKMVTPLSGDATIVMKSNYKKEYASFYFLDWLVKQEEYVDICFNELSIPLSKSQDSIDRMDALIKYNTNRKERVRNYTALVYEAAKEQVFHSRPYAPVAFPGGSQFIEELVDSFYDNVYAGLLEVDRLMIEEYYSRKEACLISSNQEMFDGWFYDISFLVKKY